MAISPPAHIDLRALARSGKPLHVSLDTASLQALDQHELLGGDLEAHVTARELAGSLFEVDITVSGHVVVSCDRCLEELVLPVETEERLRFSAEPTDDSGVLPLHGTPERYDVVWDIYETVATALPTRRTHPEGQCDADMVERIGGTSDDEA